MKRRALLVLLVMVMLLCLPGCGGELRAVERYAEQYLHTFRTEGIEKAVEYCHFEATELYSPDDTGRCMSAPAAPFRITAFSISTGSTTDSMP